MSGFRKFLKNRPNLIHILLVVISIIGAVVIYYIQGSSTQISLAEQMLHREQVIARSGAISVSGFLSGVGKEVAFLSNEEEILPIEGSNVQKYLTTVLNRWSGTPVAAIILLDKNGALKQDVNVGGISEINTDLSSRMYFLWSKTALKNTYNVGNPVISKAGVTKGEYVIPISAPIIDNKGNFKGTIVAVVSLKGLVDKYVLPLKISDSTDIYVFNSNTDVIFSTISEYVGKNIETITSSVNFPGKKKVQKILQEEFSKTTNEGKLDISFPNVGQGGKVVRSLIAYSSIEAGGSPNTVWYLTVSTPASDAFLYTGVFYTDQLISLIYFIVIILAFSIIGVTSAKINKNKS